MIKRTRLSVLISRHLNKMTTSSFEEIVRRRGNFTRNPLLLQHGNSPNSSPGQCWISTLQWNEKKYQEKGKGGQMSTKQVLTVNLQWLEREIHGSTFVRYLFFRGGTWSGISRSIYFHMLILILNLWLSLVAKETGDGYYEKLESKFFPLFQCSVSMRHKYPRDFMRIRVKSWWNTSTMWSAI